MAWPSPHVGVADAGALSTSAGLCAADSDSEKHPPGRHDPCSCCILCPSCHLGDLSGTTMIPPKGVDVPLPGIDIAIPRRLLGTETARPPGWTSSWSQRAPPHRAQRS